jgi:L-histidine N-alpha-methyltransferase
MGHAETNHERLQIRTMDVNVHRDAFARDVALGLSAPRKSLPAKYLYDDRGSQLYEQICELPEYYPYRAEREILDAYAADIHAEIAHLPLIELGSGNSAKTRYLLAEYERMGRPFVYCPVDISRSALVAAAGQLLEAYRHISIQALHTDFASHPETIQHLRFPAKAIAFFGSSMGNFTPEESLRFLRRIAALMKPDDAFLLGIDLKKSPAILIPAYDDAQGVTAAFNLNLLHRINRELEANFAVDSFEHVALYNQHHGRIEMHLRSRVAQQVTIGKIDLTVSFSPDETIHTENSYKYSVADIRDMGHEARLTLQRTWFDRQQYFLVGLFRRT